MMTARCDELFVHWLYIIAACALVVAGAFGCGGGGGTTDGGDATVEITRPADGTFVQSPRIEVAGEVDGAESVTVQGESIEAVAGEWSTDVTLGEGETTIQASVSGDSDSIVVTVDTTPPELSLESPERGAFVETQQIPNNPEVTVEGSVEDSGSGVETLKIGDGATVPIDQTNFTRSWSVEPGLNQLVVTATDRAGNQATAMRGVMYGKTVDPTANVEGALAMTLRPPVFSTAATVVEDFMTPQRVEQFVKESVQVSGFTVDDVTFSDLSVSTAVDPRGPNGDSVEAEVEVTDLKMEGTATFTSDPVPMRITVDTMTAIVELRPKVTSDNVLKLEERSSELKLDPNDVHFELTGQGDSSSIDSETVEQVAVTIARGAFRDYVVQRLTEQLYDPSVLNRSVTLLGRTLEFTVEPTQTEVSANGLFLNADIAMPGDRYADVPSVPGALSRSLGRPDQPSTDSEMEVRTHQRALDRLLHGAWRAGLFHQTVSQETLSGQDLPVDLNAGALALVLDDKISSLAEPSTPAALRFRPLLPPVASLKDADKGDQQSGDASGAADVRVGGMLVDLELRPESGDPIPVVTMAVFLKLDVEITIDGVELKLNFDADATTEIVKEPAYDMNDGEVEQVMSGLLESAPSALSNELSISGERDLNYVSLEDPSVEVHGPRADHVTVGATVAPNPEALEQ